MFDDFDDMSGINDLYRGDKDGRELGGEKSESWQRKEKIWSEKWEKKLLKKKKKATVTVHICIVTVANVQICTL